MLACHCRPILQPLLGCLILLILRADSPADSPLTPPQSFVTLASQSCTDCHSGPESEARLDLNVLAAAPVAAHFSDWRRVRRALDQRTMPPQDAEQPASEVRQQVLADLDARLDETIRSAAGDPGPTVVRRLTNAEYQYCIEDLTGVSLDVRDLLASDSVGGSGFTNSATAQFMQDATLERYIEVAKFVADHAVIGAGPIYFYTDPGETGKELSAIQRLQQLYRQHGFRASAGEGAKPYGLDRFATSFHVAWLFRYRGQLGLGNTPLDDLARQRGLEPPFAAHIWEVLHRTDPTYPLSEIIAAWNEFPRPDEITGDLDARIAQDAIELYEELTRVQQRFAGTASMQEEAALLTGDRIDVPPSTSFQARATRKRLATNDPLELNEDDQRVYSNDGRIRFRLTAERASRRVDTTPVVIFSDPQIRFRFEDQGIVEPDPMPMQRVLKAGYTISDKIDRPGIEPTQPIQFGQNPGGQPISAADFVVEVGAVTILEFELPDGANRAELHVRATLDPRLGRGAAVRCTIEDITSSDGRPYSALLRDRDDATMDHWEAGLEQFAEALPQISHREPAPSDRDPIPQPYDNTYNVAERNYFHTAVKYHRADGFLVQHLAEPDVIEALDIAWTDLLTSFDYHQINFRFATRKFGVDAEGRSIATIEPSWIEQLPDDVRPYVEHYRQQYDSMQSKLAAAQPTHLSNVIELASRAWRRELGSDERAEIRRFYRDGRQHQQLSHTGAIRATIARVLVSPDFLYRIERPAGGSKPATLSQAELASRLSFSIWSSIPDGELRSLAQRGRLSEPAVLAEQVGRMLRSEKSRRFATEFFGQWLGFYRFDQYRGVDVESFPEFDDSVREALYGEAISFFESIVRKDRPYSEILQADYTFLDPVTAGHYGIPWIPSESDALPRKTITESSHRGGLLGMGAMLTATSAPLRTSPVKRGDWILRRLIGTPVPPPPADAGSIPAEEVLDDGKTVRQRLEAHRARAECIQCHQRIDPLGFALENFDSVGRWRETYQDGQPIDASAVLADGQRIRGVEGLKAYLRQVDPLFRRTLATRLVAYFLGRSETVADAALIETVVSRLEADPRISTAVSAIVQSPQFQQIRGSGHRG